MSAYRVAVAVAGSGVALVSDGATRVIDVAQSRGLAAVDSSTSASNWTDLGLFAGNADL